MSTEDAQARRERLAHLKARIEKAGWPHSPGSLDVVYVNDVLDMLDEEIDALSLPPAPAPQVNLEGIKARLEATSEGPWKAYFFSSPRNARQYWAVGNPSGLMQIGGHMVEPDANFIAHAHEDIPALIAEVERLAAGKPTCDCGRPLTVCADCAVSEYQGEHTDCLTCCPIRGAAVRTPAPEPQTELQIAERIARGAHAGQVDKAGEPYIQHVERVVAMVDGDKAKAVAWLHDVLEDCEEWDSGDLAREGISDDVRLAVERLTRGAESYTEYIHTIHACGPELARVVKIADLRDHLRPNCPPSLRSRYENALQHLGAVPSPAEARELEKER